MNPPRNEARGKALVWMISVGASLAVSLSASFFGIDQRVYHQVTGWFWESGRSPYELGITLWPMHYRYPPLLVFLYAPLTLLPFRAAAVVWTLGKCGILAWLAARLSRRAGGLRSGAWWVAACIAVPYVVMEFRYANVQFFVFALVAAALLIPHRTFTASSLLGLAIAIKVWPLFFLPLLSAQRRWKLAIGSLSAALVLTASPALYFGWEGNLNLLGQWYEQEFNTASRPATLWFPSQSLSGVMARYLTDIDYEALPDSNYPEVNIASLPPEDVALFWIGLAAVGYAALVLAATRFRNHDLVLYGVAFCALLLLQPYSQKQSALVLLVWPAIVGAVRVGSMPKAAKTALYCAAGLAGAQPLLADSAIQRWLQVVGMDALIVALVGFALSMTLVRESGAQQSVAHSTSDDMRSSSEC